MSLWLRDYDKSDTTGLEVGMRLISGYQAPNLVAHNMHFSLFGTSHMILDKDIEDAPMDTEKNLVGRNSSVGLNEEIAALLLIRVRKDVETLKLVGSGFPSTQQDASNNTAAINTFPGQHGTTHPVK